ncbi:Serine/threonine-protein kinase PknD [bioreactor metagenome]|uniref:Serine/threonine-protein kinase PknD n=1 Tax=bioreactor metagenome TaxID=1076179 RepID=A0A644UBN8_9ZZZZ|nr:serine/threonine-protein kinase [Acidaminococcaceae bacterium]
MAVPILSREDVELIVPNCKVFSSSLHGGQKLVFPCLISDVKCAIKFILINNEDSNGEEEEFSNSEEIINRAKRELSIMRRVSSPNIIKLGDIDLTQIDYKGQALIYYSEEWIDGNDVGSILKESRVMSIIDTLKLVRDITKAIDCIWNEGNVHRDIKPQNIMRKTIDNTYVLLDLGIAFDIKDVSLTSIGCIVGTRTYVSPEQLDLKNKRSIDFRSDLFSLGVVMYQALTGKHPFYEKGMTEPEIFTKILTETPMAPMELDSNIPSGVNEIVMRLLNKRPYARYKKCSILIDDIEAIIRALEV